MTARRCPRCQATASGNFCAQCGAPLEAAVTCPDCNRPVKSGALFCSECGSPVAPRPGKPASARLPWILSVLALVVFSVALAVFVQRRSAPRPVGGTMTGTVPAAGGTGGEGGAMPSAEELANMSPREAADRLFDRAMREGESGDPERAAFFADMALQAYGAVSPDDFDVDALFHIGLLHLAMGDAGAARAVGDLLLESDGTQLYGLVLLARSADAEGESDAAASARERLRAAIEDESALESPTYAPHRELLEEEVGGSDG